VTKHRAGRPWAYLHHTPAAASDVNSRVSLFLAETAATLVISQRPDGRALRPRLCCTGKESVLLRNIIYLIGLIVVVLFIMSLLGLR